jgi:pyruvate, orthophosphate dikinase
MPAYIKQGILEKDPFETIDEAGVGKLITMSAEAGKRSAAHAIAKAGVCGK